MKSDSVYISYSLPLIFLGCFLECPTFSFAQTSWSWSTESPKRIFSREIGSTNTCTDPRNERGVCVNIRRCEAILKILRNSNQDPIAREFLRKALCGYEGRDPKVCCKESAVSVSPKPANQNVSPPSTTRPVILPSTGATVSPNIAEKEGFVNRYANIPGQEKCGYSDFLQSNRIVGGEPSELGSWPWIAALGYRRVGGSTNKPPSWRCGGALITNKHVVTAAHCIAVQRDIQLYVVRLGELNLDSAVNDGASPKDYSIVSAVPHPAFGTAGFTSDIGIVTLKGPVLFTEMIHPICLPAASEFLTESFVGYQPFVAGWGATENDGPASSELRQVQLPVVENAECKESYRPIRNAVIDERVLCAGYAQGGKDSCQGDSGGPLMLPRNQSFYLLGVVSYGKKCAEPGFPGVYTRIAKFMDWIAQNVS